MLKKEKMDYSTITSLELFLENKVKIENDFIDNFKNRENRISCMDCVLRINPLPDVLHPYDDIELKYNHVKKWAGIFQGLMIVYIAKELDWEGMWKDIERTFHFSNFLDEKEKLLLVQRFSLILDEVNGRIAKASQEMDSK